MTAGFPPQPLYPLEFDTDRSLFQVYNTSESPIAQDNSPWAEAVDILPVDPDKNEIWGDNGFANLSGELFYYDSVDKNRYGKVIRLKRCVRNIGGKKTQFNPAGTFVRGFIVAEHHNQLAIAIIELEKFLKGIEADALNLDATPGCEDDAKCPSVVFDFNVVPSTNPCAGQTAIYNVAIDGGFSNFLLDFGDGTTTSANQTGTYTYAPNAKIDPVVTVSNDSCTVVQTPIARNNPTLINTPTATPPFTVPIPTFPDIPVITIPGCTVPPVTLQFPPFVSQCFDIGPLGNISSINIPSVIVVRPPINIPSVIRFGHIPEIPSIISIKGSVEIPSRINISATLPSRISIIGSIPSRISIIGPHPSIPSNIVFLNSPNLPTTINFGAVNVPSMIRFGRSNVPSMIRFGKSNVPSLIRFAKSNIPSVIRISGCKLPSLIRFGKSNVPSIVKFAKSNVPSVIKFGKSSLPSIIKFGKSNVPSMIKFGKAPHIPSIIKFGKAPTFSKIQFAKPPVFSKIQFGKPPKLSIIWGKPPKLSCTVNIKCPVSTSALGAGILGQPFHPEDDSFDVTTIDTVANIGIPSEIKIVAPTLPSVKMVHDLPTEIQLVAPSMPSEIRLVASTPIPNEIRITSEGLNLPKSIALTHNLPKIITLQGKNIPKFIELRVPKDFPTSILLDGSQIPSVIKVVGVPESIELKSTIPSEITAMLKVPENLEVPLVYRGGPVPIQFGPALNSEEESNFPCFRLVPCNQQ